MPEAAFHHDSKTGSGEPQPTPTEYCLNLQVSLPARAVKQAICQRHLAAGKGTALIESFWMEGCDFESAADDNGNIHAIISCKGISAVTRACRLTLTQEDSHGNELNTGTRRD